MGKDENQEVMHWADQAAKAIILEKGDKESYTIASGITPSGVVHIGNFREIITVELVKRALESLGKKVRFIYSWDDFDVFRKVPKDMPKQEVLKSFLRHPTVDVPDPFDCNHESYTRHNEVAVEEDIPLVGINPEYIYQSKQYRACTYAEGIRTALENVEKIKNILNQYRKEPLADDWLPIRVFCESCKKDTINSLKYNGEYSLTYKCDCGNESTIDFRKVGIVKLPWRVDWPMRWAYEGVDFEPGGKDHSAAGGSFDTGKQIIKEVWGKEAPNYIRYDFISIKGAGGKISSSLGNVITLKDVLEIYEPAMVRWLFAGTRAKREFAISFDVDVIKLYEDFDKCERIYYDKEEVSDKEKQKQKRNYELSCVDKPAKEMPFQPSIRHLTNFILIHEGNTEKVIADYKDQVKTDADRERLRVRIECAKNWLDKYAPDDFKFSINKEVPKNNLDDKQKKALKEVANVLKEEKDLNDENLFEKFYEIIKANDLDTKTFFKAAYNILINKDRGPKLAGFLLVIKDRAVELFGKL